jgi:hypothetical protein
MQEMKFRGLGELSELNVNTGDRNSSYYSESNPFGPTNNQEPINTGSYCNQGTYGNNCVLVYDAMMVGG